MRWPNRHPHRLTPGMRRAQLALARFLPLVDWAQFDRRPLDGLAASDPSVACFGCGDAAQAVLFLLRRTPLLPDGRVDPASSGPVSLTVPGMADGACRAALWDTREGRATASVSAESQGGTLRLDLPALGPDAAVAVRQAT